MCYSPAEEEIRLRAYFRPTAGDISLTKQVWIRKEPLERCSDTVSTCKYCNNFLCRISFAQQWAAIADKTKDQMKEAEIPWKYQEHHQVFSEEGTKWLPPTRVENMEITLKDDAPEQLDYKVYPLSRKELEVLWGSLNKDLAKRYIKHRTSSYISPIFFIPRKIEGSCKWSLIIGN